MSKYNLFSPNSINNKIDTNDLIKWCHSECTFIKEKSIREAVVTVIDNIDSFVCWPGKPILLWQGCNRIPEVGKKQRYHSYPPEIKTLAKEKNIYLDGRPNGPAIATFYFSGGLRPDRFGSNNSWHIHHLYSGKFPYIDKKTTLHSAKDGNHFTQSAGLLSIHPIADAICDEFPFFSWFLRALAFKKFGYDPDSVFSTTESDCLGFTTVNIQIIYSEIH